jgi:hypothetical protein
MRRAAKVDAPHPEIVKALRKVGFQVRSTAQLGDGFPDLVISRSGGWTALVEVKSPGEKLNAAQVKFHATWPGLILVASDPESAVLKAVEACRPKEVA